MPFDDISRQVGDNDDFGIWLGVAIAVGFVGVGYTVIVVCGGGCCVYVHVAVTERMGRSGTTSGGHGFLSSNPSLRWWKFEQGRAVSHV